MPQVGFRSWLFTCFSEHMMYIWLLCLWCVTLWPHLLVILDTMGYVTFGEGAWTSIWLPRIRHWPQTDPTQGSLGEPVSWYVLGAGVWVRVFLLDHVWLRDRRFTEKSTVYGWILRKVVFLQLIAWLSSGLASGAVFSATETAFSNFGDNSCDS